jgi:hypothetical protein
VARVPEKKPPLHSSAAESVQTLLIASALPARPLLAAVVSLLPQTVPGAGGRGLRDGDDQPPGRLTLGVAVFGVVADDGPGGEIGLGFAHATRPGWWIVAALGLTVAALGYLTTTGWARGRAANDPY